MRTAGSLLLYLLGVFGGWAMWALAVAQVAGLAGVPDALLYYAVWAVFVPYLFGWMLLSVAPMPRALELAATVSLLSLLIPPACLLILLYPISLLVAAAGFRTEVGRAALVAAFMICAWATGRLLASAHRRGVSLKDPAHWRRLHVAPFLLSWVALVIVDSLPLPEPLGDVTPILWVPPICLVLHAVLTWRQRLKDEGCPVVFPWRVAALLTVPYALPLAVLAIELPVAEALAWPLQRDDVARRYSDLRVSRPGRAADADWRRYDVLPLAPGGVAPARLGDRQVQVRIPYGWRGAVPMTVSDTGGWLALRRMPDSPGELRDITVRSYHPSQDRYEPLLLPEGERPRPDDRWADRLSCWRLAVGGWECWTGSSIFSDGVRPEMRPLRPSNPPNLVAWNGGVNVSGTMAVLAPGLRVECYAPNRCQATLLMQGRAEARFATTPEHARNWPTLRLEVGALLREATGLGVEDHVPARQPAGQVLTFDAP